MFLYNIQMPSDRVHLLKGKFLPTKHSSSGGMIAGGAVPVLLDSRAKSSLEGKGMTIGANKIVGIYSPAPPKKSTDIQTAKLKPTIFQGGELLNRIAFEPYSKKGRRENIKFLF
jgi:hypothetical protein